jgi:nitroreductase
MSATAIDLLPHRDELIAAARLAPSLHNAQPWAFRVTANAVEVYTDRSRSSPIVDPDGRQLLLGVGAAVFAVRLGLAELGYRVRTEWLPDTNRPTLAAILTAMCHQQPSVLDHRLYQQLSRRRTVRRRMDPSVPGSVQKELAAHAAAEGATLRWLTTAVDRHRFSDLLQEAERRQQFDLALRLELERWVASDRVPAGSGIPAEALGPSSLAAHRTRFPQRDFTPGRTLVTETGVAPELNPALAVLSSYDDWDISRLRTGAAMHRVLLAATARGVAASFLNQPLELADLRAQLTSALQLAGAPQLVLRFGRPLGNLPVPTPRRPIDDLLRD